MKYLIALLGFCSLFSVSAFSQTDSTAGMIVHKDSRIDNMSRKQAVINKTSTKVKTFSGQIKGYRIMVLNTNDRQLAYTTKSQLLSRFPDLQVYMAYQAPFFKLKMGDFINKGDADRYKKEVMRIMPKGVFVVPDVIRLKKEQMDRLLQNGGGESDEEQ